MGRELSGAAVMQEKKVVDLSKLIESDIDCEFWEKDGDYMSVGKLVGIGELYGKPIYKADNDNISFWHCRPRMNHWHFLKSQTITVGERLQPLPDGFVVETILRNGQYSDPTKSSDLRWEHGSGYYPTTEWDIVAFKIVGLVDGWQYPWETDRDEVDTANLGGILTDAIANCIMEEGRKDGTYIDWTENMDLGAILGNKK